MSSEARGGAGEPNGGGPPPAPASARPRSGWARAALAALVVGGSALRFWFVVRVHRPVDFVYSDMAGYLTRARHFADPTFRTGPYDFFFPSGTSYVLSLFYRAFGEGAPEWAALFQAALASAAIPLVHAAARRYFREGVALAATALFAVHYLAVDYAGYFLSEGYLAFGLIAAAAACAPESPPKCFASGVLLGLATWMKTQAFLLVLLWAGAFALGRRRRAAAALLCGALAVALPASVPCSRATGRFAFVSTNGGQNFAIGQCPVRGIVAAAPDGSVMTFGLPVVVRRSGYGAVEASWPMARYPVPFYDSVYYTHIGLSCIARSPAHALRMLGLHLTDSFAGLPWAPIAPWPSWATPFATVAQASNVFISCAAFPLALLGLVLRRREAGIWLLFGLPMASVLVSAVVFHGDPRFRAPYDFGILIAACAAVDHGLARRRRPPAPSASAGPWGAAIRASMGARAGS